MHARQLRGPARRLARALVAIFLTSLAGCAKDDEADAAKLLGVTVTAGDRAAANEIFSSRCAVCHGPMGAGDGAAAPTLTPRPRKFQDHDWQASVSNEHINTIIRLGGPAVGKSALMPANADLEDRKGVVAALTGRIRGFGR
jgi:mono/diheme cytochrome c family protein